MKVHAPPTRIRTHTAPGEYANDFDHFDLVIGMDDANIADLRDLAPPRSPGQDTPRGRLPAPASRMGPRPALYYEGAEGFELVLDLLEDACLSLLDTFNENSNTIFSRLNDSSSSSKSFNR